MNVTNHGLQWYVDKIEAGETFSLARYGNGEIGGILGNLRRTPSGSQSFTPELRGALVEALQYRDETYYLALQNERYLRNLGLWSSWRKWCVECAPGIEWHFGDVFHRANRRGDLGPLVKALKARGVLMVGPEWLRSLDVARWNVTIQHKDCWTEIDAITDLAARATPGTVVSVSAGPAGKVLVRRLHERLAGRCWVIDFGSVWDVLAGVTSRRYHRSMDENVIKRNLGGKK